MNILARKGTNNLKLIDFQLNSLLYTVAYIRVTDNFNEILILSPSSFVDHNTQVN